MSIKEDILIRSTPDLIFKKYEAVDSWNTWDSDIKESSIIGEFKKGSAGVLIPTKGPKAKFILTEVIQNKSFTTQTKLPLCTLEFAHYLDDLGEYTKVTHSIFFRGLTGFIFSRLIGHQIKKSLPEALENLKKSCE